MYTTLIKIKTKMLPTVLEGNEHSENIMYDNLAVPGKALEMCLSLDSERRLKQFSNLPYRSKDV